MIFTIFAPAIRKRNNNLKSLVILKKTLFIILLLAAICIMQSCKKYASEIVFGETRGMRIMTYDSTDLQTEYMKRYYDIDLNNDGREDLQLISIYVGSHELGRSYVSHIKCLNENVALLGDIIIQEHYVHYETIKQQNGGVTYITKLETHTCERIDESDSIESSEEKLLIRDADAGETFGIEDDCMNTDVTLKDFSYSICYLDEFSPNLIEESAFVYDNESCNSFPLKTERYIGFKFNINGRDHLGWMKIILEIRDGDYCVKPIEAAIQK